MPPLASAETWFKKSLTVENGLVVAKDERRGGGKGRELGISRCNLVYIGWINTSVLLDSTGNDIQHPVTNHDGKEHEKEHVHMDK